jgi:hypothetical protein
LLRSYLLSRLCPQNPKLLMNPKNPLNHLCLRFHLYP